MRKRTGDRLARLAKRAGTSRAGIVRGYLEHQRLARFWSLVNELVRDDVEVAWLLILDLIRRAEDDQLAYVAAGPLEDLLVLHGPRVIRRVELEAVRSRRFRFALRGTWGHRRMAAAIYRRKERACADIPAY